jgi:hypothetical protein
MNARARVAALEAQVIAAAVVEDAQKMMDQAHAAAEELSRVFIGPRNGYPRAPPVPFYQPRYHWDGLRDHLGRRVTYEEYMQDYRERRAEDLIRRRRAVDGREGEMHQDTMINQEHTIVEYLDEIERHENEVGEIEERRRRDRRLGGGDVGEGGENAAALPNGIVQGEEAVVRTAREIVSELARNAAAAREIFMGDPDNDEEGEQGSDDDTE